MKVVLCVGRHAFCDDVAGKAELHRNACAVVQLFQVLIQAAHVPQSVWPELEHRLCFPRIVHLTCEICLSGHRKQSKNQVSTTDLQM